MPLSLVRSRSFIPQCDRCVAQRVATKLLWSAHRLVHSIAKAVAAANRIAIVG